MVEELNTQRFNLDFFLKVYGDLQVPQDHREYDWKTDQVEEMMNDLSEVIAEKRDKHFFGLIVLNSDVEGKKNYVIDGQQRITASFIFLAVIKNMFYKFKKDSDNQIAGMRADDLQSNYFGKKGAYRFGQSKDVNDYFEQNIMSKNVSKVSMYYKSPSEKNIYDTYMTIDKLLNAKLSSIARPNDKVAKLYEILDGFLEKFYVITLTTTSRSDTFDIFETLNNRGTELSASDLLKNHLFRISGDDLNYVTDQWDSMEKSLNVGAKLDASDSLKELHARMSGHDLDYVRNQWDSKVESLNVGAKTITEFVRSYWNSKNDFVTEKLLYKAIYSKVKTIRDAKKLVEGLNKLAPVYGAIADPKKMEYFSNEELNKGLTTLSDLGVKTYYPIMLALKENNYSENEMLNVVHEVNTFVASNLTNDGLVADNYETAFSKIAVGINEAQYESIEAINQAIGLLKHE